MKQTPPQMSAGCRLVTVLVLAHLLAVIALAASPELHHWCHHDEDDDADCAVVLYLSGGCDHPPAPLALPAILEVAQPCLSVSHAPVAWVKSLFACSRIFEHAPPIAA